MSAQEDGEPIDAVRVAARQLAAHARRQHAMGTRFIPVGDPCPGPALRARDHAPSPDPASAADPEPVPACAPRPQSEAGQPSALGDRLDPVATAAPARARGGETPADDPRRWSAARKLAYLRDKNVGDCRRCPLCKSRTNIVFGVGDPEARLMFLGEAPGAEEDARGEPFVGRAGKRLDAWIAGLGLSRDRVYIANVLKCRPPANRDPQPVEVERCAPFLAAQIRAIRPAVIVALGRHAAAWLLGQEASSITLARLRGHAHAYVVDDTTTIPFFVTYHPSYVLRREGEGARGGDGRSHERGGARASQAEAGDDDARVREDLARALARLRDGGAGINVRA